MDAWALTVWFRRGRFDLLAYDNRIPGDLVEKQVLILVLQPEYPKTLFRQLPGINGVHINWPMATVKALRAPSASMVEALEG